MPSIEDLLRQGDEMQVNEGTTFPPGLPQSVIDYILSHPSFAEGERTTTSPPESWPYGTEDNPLLQGGPEGAVIGSRPVPGSADRNTFGSETTPAPYNVPGQSDDRAMSIGDLLGYGDMHEQERAQHYDPSIFPWLFSPRPVMPDDRWSYPGQGMYFSDPPANDIAAQTGGKYGGQEPPILPGQTMTYMQPQFQDFSGLARALSQYRWAAGGNESQAIPEQYSGDIPPTLLPDFMQMVRNGLPPAVAHSILTQPSYEEGLAPNSPMGPKKGSGPWPYEYKGQEQEGESQLRDKMRGPYRAPGVTDPMQALNDRLVNRQLNLPTGEGHTPGDDDSVGFLRLPNGQYVVPGPTPGRSLRYWRNQGNPNSFYWNPQPGTYPVPDYDGGQGGP